MNFVTFVVLFSAIFFVQIESYKYLAILHWPGQSHFLEASVLMKALAEKGHEVTVISPFPQKKPIKNYHDVPIESVKFLSDKDAPNMIDWYDSSFLTNLYLTMYFGYQITERTLEMPAVQELLRSNQTFDAVICEVFFSDALYGISDHFNAPLIGYLSMGAFLPGTDMVGSPSPPSYVPHVFSPFTDRMTRWERLLNFAVLTFERIYTDFVILPRHDALYKKHFPNAKRSLYDVRKNGALMLTNQHVSLSFARPYMPNQIEVGGMHINRKPPSPLPEDIKTFIDNSKHGVIYFSMGSNIKSTNFPLEKRRAILETFRNLKQRVLWKFEDPNLPGKPDNVFISSWFPQNDILAHPNVKIFITHGGLHSATETVYYGKPMIGIPIFGDQFLNVERAVHSGYGIKLEYAKLSKAALKSAIGEILNNTKYAERVREVSQRYRDQPMDPLELAIYWVEHIVRHKGAPYLHCPGLDLNFIEYHNIDVLLIFFGGIALILCLVLLAIVKVFRKCFRASHKGKSTKKVKRQ